MGHHKYLGNKRCAIFVVHAIEKLEGNILYCMHRYLLMKYIGYNNVN